jgi:transcriptional regulator with PAS, ATPase and Fis domain
MQKQTRVEAMEGLIYGASRKFRKFMEQVEKYAAHDWSVLILGETGVGKELIAQCLHRLSGRSRYPLHTVNAAALPAGLFESELFGFEKGAFSGALAARKGLIRSAHQSTLFLDEIGELDCSLQTKLLRVLETGEVRSVGGIQNEKVDVRFIGATNLNLYVAVQNGEFRHDLLERISVLILDVPPLRARSEDIELIVHYYLQQLQKEIEPSAISPLSEYSWPGNIRQLRNLLVRACAQTVGTIPTSLIRELVEKESERFPLAKRENSVDLSRVTLADIEKQVIINRLRFCRGNRKKTATMLGIAKSTLHEKLRRYSLGTHSEEPNSGLCTA